MNPFKNGDRVRVTKTDSSDSCDVGQVGTIIEGGTPKASAMWIEFDTPTRYGHKVYHIEESKAGYCDCLNYWQVEKTE
jgi:hypothetical protein